MALFNVDKSTERRLSPSVNSHDVHLNRMALATTSISPRTSGNSAGTRKLTTKSDSITLNDGFNERLILGILPDGTIGLEISKEGYNVSDAYST